MITVFKNQYVKKDSYLFEEVNANFKVAFSLKRLSQNSSLCVRVRRSSDNQEADIGFSGGVIDEAQLLSFVGSANGHVVRWYDQVGTNHATQTIPARQPLIVQSGIPVKHNNNEYGIRFVDNSPSVFGHLLIFNIFHNLNTPYIGAFATYELLQAGNYPTVFSGNVDSGFIFYHFSDTMQPRIGAIRYNFNFTSFNPPVSLNQTNKFFVSTNRSNTSLWRNKTTQQTGTDQNIDFRSNATFTHYFIGNNILHSVVLNNTIISTLVFITDIPETNQQRDFLFDNL